VDGFGVLALMKKCPSCHAIMEEITSRAEVPELQKKHVKGTPGVSRTKVRFECTQCGHIEEEFAKSATAFGE
jgi:transcription initiation factor IIE alpha subunit